MKGGLPAPGFISLRILFYNLVDLANETEDDFDFLLSEAEVVFRCFMDQDFLDQRRFRPLKNFLMTERDQEYWFRLRSRAQ